MHNKEKLKMISTFSGVGMQERGFINSNLFDIEVVATSEIDKEAIISYAAIHQGLTNELVENYEEYPSKEEMVYELKSKNIGYDFKKNELFDWEKLAKRKGKKLEKYWLAMKLSNNLGDICKIESLPQCDLLTFSFPCQSISIAGKQEGIINGKTRSGLIYEIVRLIEIAKKNGTLPKYLMLENVSALVSKKFIKDFNSLNDFFDDIGYNVYWSLINGKDCGIPQSRNRCFAMYIRKDIDNGKYTFPVPFDTGIRLKDILEKEVDDKYYLSSEAVSRLYNSGQGYHSKICSKDNAQYSATLFASMHKIARGMDLISDDENVLKQIGYFNDYNGDANRIYSDNIARTLKSEAGGGGAKTGWYKTKVGIRKLTPRECYKLMGLTFEDCDRAAKLGISDTHLYKQAGNGIITNCCALLAEHLYKAQYDNTYICTDERYQGNFSELPMS